MTRMGLDYKNMLAMGSKMANRRNVEAFGRRNQQMALQNDQQDWQSQESGLQRASQMAQAGLERDWRSKEAGVERDWRGNQAGLQRNFMGEQGQKDRLAGLYNNMLARAPGAFNSEDFQSGLGPEADAALRRAGDPANQPAMKGNWTPFSYQNSDGSSNQVLVNKDTGEVRPMNGQGGQASNFNFEKMPDEDAYRFFQQLSPEQQEAYGKQFVKQDPEKFKRVKYALENQGELPPEKPGIKRDFKGALDPKNPNQGKDMWNFMRHLTPFGGLLPDDMGLKRAPERSRYIGQ